MKRIVMLPIGDLGASGPEVEPMAAATCGVTRVAGGNLRALKLARPQISAGAA